MESNKEEDSGHFKFKFTSVLSAIKDAKNQSLITEQEKTLLKNYIITKQPDLGLDLDEYEKDKDLRKFIATLKFVCQIDDMLSPENGIGGHLMEAKKHKKKLKDPHKGLDPHPCDYGQSPTLFSK